MNIIGEIGNFIIKYQEPIQAGVIFLLIIVGIVLICKMFINGKKKRELLSQINDTVSEINTAVNQLSEKKADVVYIDSRMTTEMKEPVLQVTEDEAGTEPEVKTAEAEEPEEAVAAEESAAEAAEEKIEPVLKYFSRDCAVSKNGKQFTFEELDAQIKE